MSEDGNILTDIDPATVRRVHLVGVAGTGMGAFAGMLKAARFQSRMNTVLRSYMARMQATTKPSRGRRAG